MGADLHIHVFEGITEDDLKIAFSNTLGSKYFAGFGYHTDYEKRSEIINKISRTPNVWVGSVSWLKASLLDDDETYIPDPVEKVSELIGENLPTLTKEIRDQILKAFDLENTTGYDVSERDSIQKFLDEHMGKKLFTFSW